MAMEQAEVTKGLVEELSSFRAVVASCTGDEWEAPTRCEGWTVADLAAHLTGVMADITAGRLEDVDTQPWYDRQVAERRGRPQAAIINELDAVIGATAGLLDLFDAAAWAGPAAPGVEGTLGAAMQSLWAGTYIHVEDVLAALGREPQRGPGLAAAVDHVANQLAASGWGPATLALEELGIVEVGGGGGRRIETDALTFVLVASGRSEPSLLGVDESVNVYRSTA
jgi:uncharacterized protein (TIGR03083 family)